MAQGMELLDNGTKVFTGPGAAFGTDALLLARFATLRKGWSVCDLGCGVGSLLLLLSQREEELDEFLSYQENEPVLTQERKDKIAKDRKELSGNFCRGCGYCMPCPAGIEINNAARMSLMLRRAPSAAWLTEEWQEKMKKIENCIHCGHCVRHCPYGLNTPELLRRNYEDYKTFLK